MFRKSVIGILFLASLFVLNPVFSETYYVKKDGSDDNNGLSWGQAFLTIYKALQVVTSGDSVWVAEGEYRGEITIQFGETFYGGFDGTETELSQRDIKNNQVIIDGRNWGECVRNYGTIDGFYVINGYAYYGGGIFNEGAVTNCTVYGNYAEEYGGGIYNNASGVVTNCTVYGNSADFSGGGIYNKPSGVVINCTVYGNSYEGIYNNASGVVINCISWNNANCDIWGPGVVSYSCFGGASGTGNISANPLFVNTSGDVSTWDFHLQDGSPCVDKGTLKDAPGSDLEGNPRPGGDSKVCMGACESPAGYLPGPPAPSKRLYVSPSGDDSDGKSWATAFNTLQSAISESGKLDDFFNIWVAAATYREGVTISVPVKVNIYGGFVGTETELSQRDIENNRVIIEGEKYYRSVINNGTIDGFYVTHGAENFGMGINNYGIVTNCAVYGNSADYGGGIRNYKGAVTNCTVYNNAAYSGGGIYNEEGAVINCTVYDNSAGDHGGGIYNEGAVTNCIVWNNNIKDIYCSSNEPVTVSYTCYETGENISGDNNIQNQPLFIDTMGDSSLWDFHLKSGSPCIDAGEEEGAPETDIEGTIRPQGAGVDMGAYEFKNYLKALFYAEKSYLLYDLSVQFHDASYGNPDGWEWDFDGDGVVDSTEQNPEFTFSEPGFYTVSLTVTKEGEEDALTKTEYIYVGRTYYVKPDGNDQNSGWSWSDAFQTINRSLEDAQLGDAVWVGAGVYREGSELIISKNVSIYGGFDGTETELSQRDIENNRVIIDGEEEYRCVSNYGTIDGLYITKGSTSKGGGIANWGVVTDCTVYNNSAGYGGGIRNYKGPVTNCAVYGNSSYGDGGGIYNNAKGVVTNCTVYDNSAINYFIYSSVGGGIYSEGEVTNCTLYDNFAHVGGGGIYNNASGVVTNCAVYDNSADDGGGIYNDEGAVTNCISWNNNNGDIAGIGDVSYSCFGGGSGTGNISANPLFVNTSGDVSTWDFKLQADSPCIDAGTENNAPDADIDGTPRPQGDGFDMGACEFPFPDSARFIAQEVPVELKQEENYDVAIAMKNIGSKTWSGADGYRLGDIATTTSLWGVSKVDLKPGITVAPDEKTSFTFTITAPTNKGEYDFQWRMFKESEDKWFGEKTPLVKVQVIEEMLPGDVNDDGVLTMDDVTLLQEHILGISALDPEAASRADGNGDNVLDVSDVITILRNL